jgi:hypothetical protein
MILHAFPESDRKRLAPRLGDAVSTVGTMMDAFELVL